LINANERLGARPQASSSAGAAAATRAAVGGNRYEPQELRAPSRRTIERSIPAARRDSTSCSHTAQASASKGSGRRRGRSQGRRLMTGPTSASRRKRR
jgi:hypothetical protein